MNFKVGKAENKDIYTRNKLCITSKNNSNEQRIFQTSFEVACLSDFNFVIFAIFKTSVLLIDIGFYKTIAKLLNALRFSNAVVKLGKPKCSFSS